MTEISRAKGRDRADLNQWRGYYGLLPPRPNGANEALGSDHVVTGRDDKCAQFQFIYSGWHTKSATELITVLTLLVTDYLPPSQLHTSGCMHSVFPGPLSPRRKLILSITHGLS